MDVENETGCGIVPYTYKERNLVNAVQWAVGLELLLLIDDPWRIFLTTDHPNGGCFWRYPELIRLLMNADFRRECVKRLPAKAQKRIVLADLDREYTLSEIAIITSAGPARALGLSQKGHLGVGADADIAIYDENPDGGLMFEHPRYVIKGGEVVVEEEQIRAVTQGREFIVRPAFDEQIEEYLRPLFEKVYTMSFDNYPVEMERLAQPDACKRAHADHPDPQGAAHGPPRSGGPLAGRDGGAGARRGPGPSRLPGKAAAPRGRFLRGRRGGRRRAGDPRRRGERSSGSAAA